MPCYIERLKDGGIGFLCGSLGPHCEADGCAASTSFLCDYPIGDLKTCDLALCGSHAYEVAADTHYCPNHLLLWQELRAEARKHLNTIK